MKLTLKQKDKNKITFGFTDTKTGKRVEYVFGKDNKGKQKILDIPEHHAKILLKNPMIRKVR